MPNADRCMRGAETLARGWVENPAHDSLGVAWAPSPVWMSVSVDRSMNVFHLRPFRERRRVSPLVVPSVAIVMLILGFP